MAGSALIRGVLLALGIWCACGAPAAAQLASRVGGQSERTSESPSEKWFRIERLNSGLPPAPDALDRATPMSALESFLDAVADEDYARAAYLLDLGGIPEPAQARRGPELARKLGEMIANHVWLDWSDLPDRPDGLLQEGPESDPMVGKMRRSVRLARLEVDGRPVPIRISRVKPDGQEPVWVFSRFTVNDIDELYRTYGPGWIEERVPPSWRKKGWLSLPWWEFVALPAAMLVAALIFVIVRGAIGMLSRLAPRSVAAHALRATRTPLAMVAATAPFYYAATALMMFSAPVEAILSPVLIALLAIAIGIGLLRLIDGLIGSYAERYIGRVGTDDDEHQRHLYTTLYAARRVLVLVAFVAGIGLVLLQLNLFSALGVSLLASAGVLTVILAIAAQQTLGNILASLQIALGKPIRIGDAVHYEGEWAYVEAIFYTFVRLRTWDDRRLVVPVKYFVSKPFENWSMVEEKMTRVFTLTLDPRTDVEALRQTYLDMARADEDLMEEGMLKALVVDQDHNGIVVRFYCTAKDATTAWNLHCRLRERTLAWVRQNHPDWWPRQRELQLEQTRWNEAAE